MTDDEVYKVTYLQQGNVHMFGKYFWYNEPVPVTKKDEVDHFKRKTGTFRVEKVIPPEPKPVVKVVKKVVKPKKHVYTRKDLKGKNHGQLQAICEKHGINPNDATGRLKRSLLDLKE